MARCWQYERMKPGGLARALASVPVAYLVVSPLEWMMKETLQIVEREGFKVCALVSGHGGWRIKPASWPRLSSASCGRLKRAEAN